MRAVWLLLIVAAAVLGYLAGARSGEGPGTRARESPRPADAPATVPSVEQRTPPESPEQDLQERPAEQAPPSEVRVDPVHPVPLEQPPTPLDPVHAGSPFDTRLRDDLDRGGAMALLRGLLDARPGRPWTVAAAEGAAAVVGDDGTFPKIFSRQKSGSVVHGPGADWSTLADGTTLVYPEGVFAIDWTEAPERLPRDLLLKGAGMDRTLLRISRARRGENEEIHGLTLAALTIDCGNEDLLWPKSGLAAVRLVECRIARTETILDGPDAGAIRAERCEFEGGRRDGGFERCRLLATGRGLARLDDCTIRGSIDVYDTGHVACLFRRCTFVQVHANLQSNLERRPGVRLEGCRFEVAANPPPPRPLHAINPAWRD